VPLRVETIDSVARLLGVLPDLYRRGRTMWFRGHANHNWHLEPSLARLKKLNCEMQLIKRFKQNAFQFLGRVPKDEWEWIFLMQHYRVPTRLLDWTESPLIGLYFAVSDTTRKHVETDAALWCLYPQKLNEISGLALDPPGDIPAFGDEIELEDYLPSRVHAQQATSKNPLAIIAPRQFERIYAQQGVFTILHRKAVRIDELKDQQGNQSHLVKLRIRRAAIVKLRRELGFLRINKLTIFPQLEHVAESAAEGILQ
jgi:FRG domain